MRLLKQDADGNFSFTRNWTGTPPQPYAILSHTWSKKAWEEVSFDDIQSHKGQHKPGFQKLIFCAEEAKKLGYNLFWIDTCCINKHDAVELQEAITSMYKWYESAAVCLVYLSDVGPGHERKIFKNSRWFTRGWTLQEMLAPRDVRFFNVDGKQIGDKVSKAAKIEEVTGIPQALLTGEAKLEDFPVADRMQWTQGRQTTKPEDRAYCLLGIFGVVMFLSYGEDTIAEGSAFLRLQKEIESQGS